MIWPKLFSVFVIVMAVAPPAGAAGSVTDLADPMIGTKGEGHVYPGAAVPFGFVQISPDEPGKGEAWCSGYDYSDTKIAGFSLNHLTGTGCPDLGNFLFTPGYAGDPHAALDFMHENEKAQPGFYRVRFSGSDIVAELTATTHCGLQRYTFPRAGAAQVVIDLAHGVGNHATDATLTIEKDHCVSGFRREIADGCLAPGGPKEYYFVAEFSRPFAAAGILKAGAEAPPGATNGAGADLKVRLSWNIAAGESVVARVALSSVSVEGGAPQSSGGGGRFEF